MAYNREWDHGKDTWNDAGAWTDASGKAHLRSRDGEQYGEGKRRKYNNGGYDATQSYDEAAYEAAPIQPRQNDYSQDYSQDERPQRGLAKKRLIPSEPSPHVIFLGLDPDFTEADLQAYLANNGCSIETVTIIRERTTGVSKGFGFAQFTSTEHARAFVDPLFPFIQIPPPASHGASATATFYKALETGIPHNGRRVKIDYSQSVNPSEKGRLNRQNMNDGTRDIGNSQVSLLLFRGLDPLSGPQAIAQAMYNSSGPGKQGAKGMKRILLIKDKVTMASFGFAFVEFVDVQSASAVLAATMSPEIHPSGFRISDRPVAASFAHPYSFQPSTDYLSQDEACLPSSLGLGGAKGSMVRYWDETATLAKLEFEVEEPVHLPIPVKDKKEKRKDKGGDEVHTHDLPPAPAGASTLPVSDKPVTLNFSKGIGNKLSTKSSGPPPVKPLALGFSFTDELGTDPSDNAEDIFSNTEENKFAAAKKVPLLIASKKTVNNINKWNQVQGELANSLDPLPGSATLTTAPRTSGSPPSSKPTLAVAPVVPAKLDPAAPAEAEFEFSDTGAMTCLLCARQFKSMDQLKRHNKESDLHKKNYQDVNLREVARQKANAIRQAFKSAEQPKYRDRASERRIMHNQPDTPMPVVEKDNSNNKKRAEGPSSPPPLPVNPGRDESNVGNKLLKMMGWTEGTGLGTSGEGRVDPIQTAMYAQGAGLGASKGKELGKYPDGYSGYVHMAQDAARDRYGS